MATALGARVKSVAPLANKLLVAGAQHLRLAQSLTFTTTRAIWPGDTASFEDVKAGS